MRRPAAALLALLLASPPPSAWAAFQRAAASAGVRPVPMGGNSAAAAAPGLRLLPGTSVALPVAAPGLSAAPRSRPSSVSVPAVSPREAEGFARRAPEARNENSRRGAHPPANPPWPPRSGPPRGGPPPPPTPPFPPRAGASRGAPRGAALPTKRSAETEADTQAPAFLVHDFNALRERVLRATRLWGLPVEEIFRESDVLLLGEDHSSLSSIALLIREMPRLKAAGVTHLAVEGLKLPQQAAMDRYLAGEGELPEELLAFSPPRRAALRALFTAAKSEGMAVLAVDKPLDKRGRLLARLAAERTGLPRDAFHGDLARQLDRIDQKEAAPEGVRQALASVTLTARNRDMARRLARALREGGKAVVLIGSAHLDPPEGSAYRLWGLDIAPFGTLAGELSARALKAYSATLTGGSFLVRSDARLHAGFLAPLYRLVAELAPDGAEAFLAASANTAIYHLGGKAAPVKAEAASGEQAQGRDAAPSAPRRKLSRALRVGVLTALAVFALDMAALAAASLGGYSFRPTYEMPPLADPAAFSALGWLAPAAAKLQEFFLGAFLAPLNEEPYFRAGVIGLLGAGATALLGGLAWLISKLRPSWSAVRKWVNPAAFLLVATEAAWLFVILHESGDPLLMALRLVQALLFSYLYVKEGLASSLAHHMAFNFLGLLLLPLVFASSAGAVTVLLPQALAAAAGLGLLWLAGMRATRGARARERAELAAGRLAPYRLSARASRWLGAAAWASVGVLSALVWIQPSIEQAFLLGAMAAQLAPAAVAFWIYGALLGALAKRKGAGAVEALWSPAERFPLGNRIGWLAGATVLLQLTAVLLGAVGAAILGFLKYSLPLEPPIMGVPQAAVWPAFAALGALWLAARAARLLLRRKGSPAWLYVTSAVLDALVLGALAAPLVAYAPVDEIQAIADQFRHLSGF